MAAARDQDEVYALREQFDPGEVEAIVLAGELMADLLLVDVELPNYSIFMKHG